MSAKKPASERRAGQALEAYEKAVKALGKRDFERAAELFQGLIDSYPGERDLAERARSYLAVCRRALDDAKRSAFKPRNVEEALNMAVYHHNRGEFEDALRVLRPAASAHADNDHVLYCLAASAARSGDTPAAIAALRAAIALSTTNRAQARVDSDFDPIRDEDDFVQLVYERALVDD